MINEYLSFCYINSLLSRKYKLQIWKIKKKYINYIEIKTKNNIFNKNYLHIITKKDNPEFFKKYLMNQIEVNNQLINHRIILQ